MFLLIIDDHLAIMRGIARLFADDGTFYVVGMTKNWQEASSVLATACVDVVLLDIEFHGSEDNGFLFMQRIKQKYRDVKTIVYSNHDNFLYREKARVLGAGGYVAKGCDFDQLLSTLKKVCAGTGCCMSFSDEASRLNTLSENEERVVHYLARGMAQKQIADEMNVKPSTVATYVQRIKQKLGVSSITELVAVAGLLNTDTVSVESV